MVGELIERVASCLEDEGIPYMIVGGQAVLVYGEPRLTKDIDITLGLGLEGLPGVLRAAKKAGLEILVDDPEGFAGKTMVVPARDSETGLRVDFMLSYSEYERVALSSTRAVRVGQKTVRFISPEESDHTQDNSGKTEGFGGREDCFSQEPWNRQEIYPAVAGGV